MSNTIVRLNEALEDRYAIERELGRGGMATVYLARDLRHDRQVAIKVLKPELAALIGSQRFLEEIRTTARLQHPHILALFDSGEADGFVFYVMPYVDGESLRDRLNREKQLPVEDAVKIAKAVADALDYAHRQGVIHRDIKPANVLLHDGNPVVADFGIALAVSAAGGGRLTETGLSLGTPHYMSPEQATGDRDLDARSDIYALGCITYEMLVGDPPHTAGTAQAVIAKILTEAPASVTDRRPSIPAHVAASVGKALERLPADRFRTATDFGAALSNPDFVGAAARHAGPAASGPLWRRSTTVLGGAALVLAAVATWGWLRPVPDVGVTHVTIPPPRGLDFVPGGWTPALSPDGSTVVFAARTEDSTMLYRRPIDGFEAEPIEGTEDAEYPFFSPDGTWIGFYTRTPHEMRRVQVEGGRPITITPLSAFRNDAHWRQDGIIMFSYERQGLFSVPETGGEVTRITTPDVDSGEQDHLWPRELTDGRILFAVRTSGGFRPAVLARDETTWRTLAEGGGGLYLPEGIMLVPGPSGDWSAFDFDLGNGLSNGRGVPVLPGALQSAALFQTPLSLSARGDVAFFSSNGQHVSFITQIDSGGGAEELFPEPATYRWPRLSPDGTRLTVGRSAAEGGMWVLDLRSGAFRPVPFEVGMAGESAWSPDGRELGYTVEQDPRGIATIYARAADGSGSERLLVATDFDAWASAWSPDSRYLAFYGGGAISDVWLADLVRDGAIIRVTDGPGDKRHPAFSPDGRWIAYQSDQSGRNEISVTGFPEFAVHYPVSVDGGTEPLWTADGRELVFRNGSRMMVVEVGTEPEFTSGAPRELFRTFLEDDLNGDRSYDVMPDGRTFVILRSDPRSSPELRVIKNWTAELRSRLGG